MGLTGADGPCGQAPGTSPVRDDPAVIVVDRTTTDRRKAAFGEAVEGKTKAARRLVCSDQAIPSDAQLRGDKTAAGREKWRSLGMTTSSRRRMVETDEKIGDGREPVCEG